MEQRPVSQHAADFRPAPGALPGGMLAVLEASPAPIVVIDSAARISYLNLQVEATFGYTRDELLGQPIKICCHPA